jgi:hypothetical protein
MGDNSSLSTTACANHFARYNHTYVLRLLRGGEQGAIGGDAMLELFADEQVSI